MSGEELVKKAELISAVRDYEKRRTRRSEGKVELISDNASFHFEHNWISFLKKDLLKLLAIKKDEIL